MRQLLFCILLTLPALPMLPQGCCSPVQAAPLSYTAQFTELTVALSDEGLQLFALLHKSVTDEMKEVLHSGIPLEFTFFVELFRTTGDASEQLLSRSFTHTIQYNTLREEYRVTFEEKPNRNNTFSSLDKAVKALETLNGITVTQTGQLLPGNRYRLRLKADLFHKTLPPGLESFLPFLSWNSRKTQWQSVDFRY